jgi:hypothetical protein
MLLAELSAGAGLFDPHPAPGAVHGGIYEVSPTPDYGIADQLHSMYAERAKMEAAIGLSDVDDVIYHVMQLRREVLSAKSDARTAIDILANMTKRLDTL